MLPSELYHKKIKDHSWEINPAQLVLIKKLDSYTTPLRYPLLVQKLFKSKFKSGIYLWGDVGSGKTSLIDIMMKCLAKEKAQRVHFHNFMEDMKKSIQEVQGKKNPVEYVIKKKSKKINILFIDEFNANDIGYAIILNNILKAALKYKIFLITTANREPSKIYTGVINKELFNPAVQVLEHDFDVIKLESGLDYRSLNNDHNTNFFYPITKVSKKMMSEMFLYLCKDAAISGNEIIINKRKIKTIKNSQTVLWLDFDNLCQVPRCQADYIEMNKTYSCILVSNLRHMSKSEKDIITNFCNFIDVAYDNNIRVIIESTTSIEN
ncbi:MAG: cell division protein ZapE, partial [Pseudomonadota bacterium]|nr:cell division protein ZapE [Pseudomonadota bacterium]